MIKNTSLPKSIYSALIWEIVQRIYALNEGTETIQGWKYVDHFNGSASHKIASFTVLESGKWVWHRVLRVVVLCAHWKLYRKILMSEVKEKCMSV